MKEIDANEHYQRETSDSWLRKEETTLLINPLSHFHAFLNGINTWAIE